MLYNRHIVAGVGPGNWCSAMEFHILMLMLLMVDADILESNTTEEILHLQTKNMTMEDIESNSSLADDVNNTYLTTQVMTSDDYLTMTNASTMDGFTSDILRYTNTALTAVGLVANILACITLISRKEGFNDVVLVLLRYQSVIDAIVCLISLAILVAPRMWSTGIKILDTIVCYIWHTQITYWWFFYVSMANLMVLTIERYIAVCHPFKHADLSPVHAKVALAFSCVCVSFIVTLQYLDVFEGVGMCEFRTVIPHAIAKYYSPSIGFFSWIVNCIAPCICLFVVYGKIINTLKKRQSETLGHSRVVVTAMNDLTKTAIAATVIQLIASGYISTVYLLNRFGVDIYNGKDATIQLGVLFSAINASANPFIYIVLMPVYKRNFLLTFCRCQLSPIQGTNQEITGSETHQSDLELSSSRTEMSGRSTERYVP